MPRFCNECNNLLIPKEKKSARQLWLACRSCNFKAKNLCAYRNVIKHGAAEQTQFLQGMAQDPTLPRTFNTKCPECAHNEAAYFQVAERGTEEDGVAVCYVCCNAHCSHKWREGETY